MAKVLTNTDQLSLGELMRVCLKCKSTIAFTPKEVYLDFAYMDDLAEVVRCPNCNTPIILSHISLEEM